MESTVIALNKTVTDLLVLLHVRNLMMGFPKYAISF